MGTIVGETKKDLILILEQNTVIGKRFMQNWIESRKYFSNHHYQSFRKVQY